MCRTDPEGHQHSLPCDCRGTQDGGRERSLVAYQMVRRQYEQHRIVAVPRLRVQRGERDGRRRVAAERLEQERGQRRLSTGQAGIDVPRAEVQIAVGDGDELATPGNASARTAAFPRSVSPSGSGMNGFGAISRDSGHSRVPAPPERITGIRGRDEAMSQAGTGRRLLKPGESTPSR